MNDSIVFARGRQCEPSSNTYFHLSPHPKRHFDRFSRFCTDHCRLFIYFSIGCSFPPQKCTFAWGSGLPSGPTRVHTPNGISIVPVFLQRSRSWQTDRQTHHWDQTTPSATIRRICVRSTAMRPINNTQTIQSKRENEQWLLLDEIYSHCTLYL